MREKPSRRLEEKLKRKKKVKKNSYVVAVVKQEKRKTIMAAEVGTRSTNFLYWLIIIIIDMASN